MKIYSVAVLLLFCIGSFWQLNFSSGEGLANQRDRIIYSISKPGDSSRVYQSENLEIYKLSERVYVHVSYLNTNDFGRVGCNGMLLMNKGEAVVFDTPADSAGTAELIGFIMDSMKSKMVAVVPTHFHNDCVGGIELFMAQEVPVYANNKTIDLLKKEGKLFASRFKGFSKRMTLKIGGKKIIAEYFGEGHTVDNIIGYFPSEEVMFGGCLVKETGASKGYLGDANIQEWPATIERIRKKFPSLKTVVPGHGSWGGFELLDYTKKLFSPGTQAQ